MLGRIASGLVASRHVMRNCFISAEVAFWLCLKNGCWRPPVETFYALATRFGNNSIANSSSV